MPPPWRMLSRIPTGCAIATALLTGCASAKAPEVMRFTETVFVTASSAPPATENSEPGPNLPAAPPPGTPRVATPGGVVLEGIQVVPRRMSPGNYRRAAFGENWSDDHDAPGGHNGCDTRNDILNRDLVAKTYKSISSCPTAVATGTLHDPYTGTSIAFTRGPQTGAEVQIDHIVPLAYAWDMGASIWTDDKRIRFANDPANLLAVQGDSNQSKGDKEPAEWMPPNSAFDCQYATRFAGILRDYTLPIDAPSAAVVTQAAETCPAF